MEKSNPRREKEREKEEKKKNADNSGHYVLSATPKDSTCSSLGPKMASLGYYKKYPQSVDLPHYPQV